MYFSLVKRVKDLPRTVEFHVNKAKGHVTLKTPSRINPTVVFKETVTIEQARFAWKELVADGYIQSELFDRDKIDQDKELSPTNCMHHTSFEGRCNACFAITD